MTDLVKVAFITATPSTVAALLGFINSRHIQKIGATVQTVEKHTNDMLSKIKGERDAARSEADNLQGQQTGVAAEQARTTKGT